MSIKIFDRIFLSVPAGKKSEWVSFAELEGYKNLNDFIIEAMNEKKQRMIETKKKLSRRKIRAEPVIVDIPNCTYPGIYALVDENGKAYIGSSVNIEKRIKTHNYFLSVVKRDQHIYGNVSHKLGQAVLEGHIFHALVLEKIPTDKIETLSEREKYYISKQGGLDNMYNGTWNTQRQKPNRKE